MKRTKWFILFLSLQILLLSLMGASWIVTGMQGKEIRLQTNQIDPNDLFYGDYLSLDYKVNKVPLSLWKGDKSEIARRKNKSVYVALLPKKGLWEVAGVYPKKPQEQKQGILLKALLGQGYDTAKLDLTYGIEQFYIQEGSGKKWNRDESLVAVVRVSSWGQLRIMRLEKRK